MKDSSKKLISTLTAGAMALGTTMIPTPNLFAAVPDGKNSYSSKLEKKVSDLYLVNNGGYDLLYMEGKEKNRINIIAGELLTESDVYYEPEINTTIGSETFYHYTVKKGDTAWAISDNLGIEDSKKRDFINDLSKIQFGDESILERFLLDTIGFFEDVIYFSNPADGIPMDNLEIGDDILLDEDIISGYGLENLINAGFYGEEVLVVDQEIIEVNRPKDDGRRFTYAKEIKSNTNKTRGVSYVMKSGGKWVKKNVSFAQHSTDSDYHWKRAIINVDHDALTEDGFRRIYSQKMKIPGFEPTINAVKWQAGLNEKKKGPYDTMKLPVLWQFGLNLFIDYKLGSYERKLKLKKFVKKSGDMTPDEVFNYVDKKLDLDELYEEYLYDPETMLYSLDTDMNMMYNYNLGDAVMRNIDKRPYLIKKETLVLAEKFLEHYKYFDEKDPQNSFHKNLYNILEKYEQKTKKDEVKNRIEKVQPYVLMRAGDMEVQQKNYMEASILYTKAHREGIDANLDVDEYCHRIADNKQAAADELDIYMYQMVSSLDKGERMVYTMKYAFKHGEKIAEGKTRQKLAELLPIMYEEWAWKQDTYSKNKKLDSPLRIYFSNQAQKNHDLAFKLNNVHQLGLLK